MQFAKNVKTYFLGNETINIIMSSAEYYKGSGDT